MERRPFRFVRRVPRSVLGGWPVCLAVLAFFGGASALLGAGQGKSAGRLTPEQSLMKVDEDFSRLSQAEGMDVAFLAFAADDAVLLREKTPPIKGRAEIEKRFATIRGKKIPLQWAPEFAVVARSKDLGYTFGHWTLSIPGAEPEGGFYVTVWKKQADGAWKWVFDTGNTIPPAGK